jgi:hypothetical protein
MIRFESALRAWLVRIIVGTGIAAGLGLLFFFNDVRFGLRERQWWQIEVALGSIFLAALLTFSLETGNYPLLVILGLALTIAIYFLYLVAETGAFA